MGADEALDLFVHMQEEGIFLPNAFTYVSVLSACANLALLDRGKQPHGHIIRIINGEEFNVFLFNALIDMYCKCGDMKSTRTLFEGMPERDIVSWNSLITGFAQNGNGDESLNVFKRMTEAGIKPYHATFLGELSVCSHASLLHEGLQILDSVVKDCDVTPRSDHYTIVIDLLGRKNRLKKAIEDLVPGLHPLRSKDLPISKSNSVELSILCKKTSSAIIWNTLDSLENPALSELQHHHQIPFFPTGPLFKISSLSSTSLLEENIDCIWWLDKQAPNSVLYISLGSLASMNETELAEMGFDNVVGGRGCIVKRAPQKEVLAHSRVGKFWSYCGWNSVLESVSEGVPMICSLCFGDQKVNVRYVSSVWKVALELVRGWIGERGDKESGEKAYEKGRRGGDEVESY
ncbi:unnamed protein product [Camellia sinensis]